MEKLSLGGIALIVLSVFLLTKVMPSPVLIPSQAVLNVEEDKTATIFVGITTDKSDSDQSDGNFTKQEGSYEIRTTNGTIVDRSGITQVDGVYQTTIEYSPKTNSTITAKIVEKLYWYNATSNSTGFINEKVLATQAIDVSVTPKATQEAPVVVTTSSGYRQPVASSTVKVATTPVVEAQPGFWQKYGLFIILSVSLIVFGVAVYMSLARRRR